MKRIFAEIALISYLFAYSFILNLFYLFEEKNDNKIEIKVHDMFLKGINRNCSLSKKLILLKMLLRWSKLRQTNVSILLQIYN